MGGGAGARRLEITHHLVRARREQQRPHQVGLRLQVSLLGPRTTAWRRLIQKKKNHTDASQGVGRRDSDSYFGLATHDKLELGGGPGTPLHPLHAVVGRLA